MTVPPLFGLSARRALVTGGAGGIGLGVSEATHHVGTALETSLERWDDTIEVNLTSVFELCRLAGALMVPRGAGKIVTIASMVSFQSGFRAANSASKGGVAQLTKAVANEWAPHGVNVNAIAPGYVKTPLNSHIWRDDPERSEVILACRPAGRWGEPADLAGAVVFLAPPASEHVHGIVLPVDGGWLGR
jgi:2-deoxy-D-gluconate 3-dehydrogenase